MDTIQLSTGAIFRKDSVSRVIRFKEPVVPAEQAATAEATSDRALETERDILVIEMKEGPAERVEGEHAAVDAAKLEQAGFSIADSL